MMSKNNQLNHLFEQWPDRSRGDFHPDGIVNEMLFGSAKLKLLFVMAEPSSYGMRFSHLLGCDLRNLYNTNAPRKELTHNMALWTIALIERLTQYERLPSEIVQNTLRTVAIINLKKFSGTSKADYTSIGLHAWHDRAFIRKEIAIISPELILTCGKEIHKLFGAVMNDERFWSTEAGWEWNGISVENVQHPATRGGHIKRAFARICEIAPKLRSGGPIKGRTVSGSKS
jgi:hypothetical protein